MAWRVAASLLKMRDQANACWPNRSKSSDGTVGDAAHASRKSDHNPWVKDGGTGVVTAFDLTHDPGKGVDTWAMAEHLRQTRDPRIKYVISNHRIFNSTDWKWKKYTGSNPHSLHMHVSVHSAKTKYDDTCDWSLAPGAGAPAGPGATGLPLPTVRRGDSGPYVEKVQKYLGVPADGAFGKQTETAVINFQKSKKLTADGAVGPRTWDALGETKPSD